MSNSMNIISLHGNPGPQHGEIEIEPNLEKVEYVPTEILSLTNTCACLLYLLKWTRQAVPLNALSVLEGNLG